MRYLTVGEVLDLYSRVMQQSGGLVGIRDVGALESAVAQPRMTFDGAELYPTWLRKHQPSGSRSSRTIPSLTATNAPVMQRWKHCWFSMAIRSAQRG